MYLSNDVLVCDVMRNFFCAETCDACLTSVLYTPAPSLSRYNTIISNKVFIFKEIYYM